MPELTAAQKRKMAKLEVQADAIANGTSAVNAPETLSLSIMLAEGNSVTIGDKDYEVAAFPVSKLGKAGKLIAQCPELMVSAALAAAETGELGVGQTADVLNRLTRQVQPDAEDVSEDVMAYAFTNMAIGITEENSAAMTPLAVLALSRKHPGITEADIEDDLDVSTFLILLCRIFAENTALRKRF